MKSIIIVLFISTTITLTHANKTQIGFALSNSNNVYKGASSKENIVPIAFAQYNNFYIEGLVLGYNIFNKNNFSTSIELSSDFLGYKNSDSIYLSTLENKKSTLNTILKTEYSTPTDLKIIGKFHYDISNRHNSYSVEVGIEYMFLQNKNHTLISNLTLEYMDKKKSNYYYGVSSHEVNPNIFSYEANKAYNSAFGLKYIYDYNDSWSFFSDMQRTFLDTSISNSPIVTTDHKNTFLVGVLYAW